MLPANSLRTISPLFAGHSLSKDLRVVDGVYLICSIVTSRMSRTEQTWDLFREYKYFEVCASIWWIAD
jgi:hypothetical protein